MKKKIIALLLAATLGAAGLTACGSSSDSSTESSSESSTAESTESTETVTDPTAYLSGITASDYVDLADYSSIPVEEAQPSVSDDYLDAYIQYQLSLNTTTEEVTDRDDVEDGDIVNIDYVGKIDGEAFDGGTATDQDLTIGSGTYIDGFEDGLIGHKVGETVDLDLTFPDDYSSTDLAGKEAVFTVTINSIKESVTPELDDDFVASQNIDGVTTVAQYRTYIKRQLMEQAQQTYEEDVEDQEIQYLQENSTFKQDPPEAMVDRFNQSYTDTLTQYATQYGLDLATFMTYQGSSEDTYVDDIRSMAESAAKGYIIMQAIADREDLNVSDEEYEETISEQASSLGYSSVEDFESSQDVEAYKEYLMVQKVFQFLLEHADVSEPSTDEASTESATEETTESAAEETTEESTEEATEETTEAAEESATEAATEAATEEATAD